MIIDTNHSVMGCVLKFVFSTLLMSTLSACISVPSQTNDNMPVAIAAEPTPTVVDGSIYQASNNRFLFEDVRARRVGDVINVVLEERTDATKAASTSTNKASGINIPGPTILGGPVSVRGREVFSNDINSASEFTGQADSSQSNRLSGSVAVTVHHKLPNGNLWIKGQKTLTLNQGSEIVKVSGQIRPTDIAPDNTVRSSQIADAQITYGGTGILANANRAGWLTRVFHSPLWPF
ncbi:MAG: flagellar basal body L-ring protein FlgH [Granulosicoccaceae bacterium]